MKPSNILYLVSFACFATILPLSLPTQAETSSQNSIEITRQESNRYQSNSHQGRQSKDSKHIDRRDHDTDHKQDHQAEHGNRNSHDSNREHDGKASNHNEHR